MKVDENGKGRYGEVEKNLQVTIVYILRDGGAGGGGDDGLTVAAGVAGVGNLSCQLRTLREDGGKGFKAGGWSS